MIIRVLKVLKNWNRCGIIIKRPGKSSEFCFPLQTFVVEVIQFRNAFDAQGPSVPGITPEEAVTRLHAFQQKYRLYDGKRKTLDSVSKLFGIK